MTQPLRNRLPGLLLAGVLVSACGAPQAPEPAAEAQVETVDPAELEAQMAVEEAPAAEAPVVPDWQPQIEAVPKSGLRAALRAAKEAHEAGRLLGITNTVDVVDAVVVTVAVRQTAIILTSDPADIGRLVSASGREIAVVPV